MYVYVTLNSLFWSTYILSIQKKPNILQTLFMSWIAHLYLLYKFGILTIPQIMACTGVCKQDERHSDGQTLGNRGKN